MAENGYKDKPNTGVLFKNDRKETDNHPDYTGTWVDDDGTEFFLSAWINKSRSGMVYMKLARGPAKEAKPEIDPDEAPF